MEDSGNTRNHFLLDPGLYALWKGRLAKGIVPLSVSFLVHQKLTQELSPREGWLRGPEARCRAP
jgi:hypothetical protein